MHVLKGRANERGLMIDIKVMQSNQRVDALKKADQPFSQPITILGLLDTGAGSTALDRGVVRSLGLQPRGITRIHTPSTGSQYEERNLYDAFLVIGENYPKPLALTLPVLECDLASEGFFALIGNDILGKCFLMYDGPEKSFTLFF